MSFIFRHTALSSQLVSEHCFFSSSPSLNKPRWTSHSHLLVSSLLRRWFPLCVNHQLNSEDFQFYFRTAPGFLIYIPLSLHKAPQSTSVFICTLFVSLFSHPLYLSLSFPPSEIPLQFLACWKFCSVLSPRHHFQLEANSDPWNHTWWCNILNLHDLSWNWFYSRWHVDDFYNYPQSNFFSNHAKYMLLPTQCE